MIYQNILQTIGQTPLVKINRLWAGKKTGLFAKIEGVNPGGSIKDRVVMKMIEEGEASGRLNKKKVLLEATSGNTGIALAMIGAVKGYRVKIIMSEAVSEERKNMIRAFGADLFLTPGRTGTDGAILKVRELLPAEPEKYFCPDQFSNEYNKIAHYEGTAQEIWHQMNGQVDYFVSAIGTSGTLMGVAAYLRKYNPKVKIYSAEPQSGHYIQGLKNMQDAIVPAIYERDKLDGVFKVKTAEAHAMARRIIRLEGIFVGMSSGAAMTAALKLAKKIKSGNIVTIFPDRGEKYLSTELFFNKR